MKGPLTFASLEEEVRFLRGLVGMQRIVDDVLEDCLENRLGLSAALDVFLSQCARMIHAHAAFVAVRGVSGVVLQRHFGSEPIDALAYDGQRGPKPFSRGDTLFVAPLDLGKTRLGTLGFALKGSFEEGGGQVQALVDAIAELLDSALLSFLALSEEAGPLERLDELAETQAFRPRGRIGKYELVTPLGTGGMAQVMVARTVGPAGVGRLVALKRILPHLSGDAGMVKQFLDEARLGLKLQHPNLVTFYDFGQSGTGYFMAMELVRGVDFDLLLSTFGKLTPAIAAGVLLQTLEGLHAAHELRADDGLPLGLVHRDLSPHNLMVGFDGRVKVLDFGVAKARNQRTLTLPGIVKGKPLYMSPEQAAGERLDRRSDLFAVGLMLYEAVVGTRAFEKGDDTRSMEAIVNDALARPAGMSDAVWAVVAKACAKAPEARFRTAAEMAAALRETLSPVSADELGRLVSNRFPSRLSDYSHWERLADDWSRATLKKVNSMPHPP